MSYQELGKFPGVDPEAMELLKFVHGSKTDVSDFKDWILQFSAPYLIKNKKHVSPSAIEGQICERETDLFGHG